MDFIKMHGTRNSYLFFEGDIDDPSGVSRRLSHEYGSDGIILILPSDICDYRMRIFNADGSEAMMCGNAYLRPEKSQFLFLTFKTTQKLFTIAFKHSRQNVA